MKAVVFVPLLALALGGFSAHAADSGSHTINLAVGVSDPLLSIVLANETVNIDMETQIAPSGRLLAPLGLLSMRGENLVAATTCTLSASSANNWFLIKQNAIQGGEGEPGRPIPYLLSSEDNQGMLYGYNQGYFLQVPKVVPVVNNSCSYDRNLYFLANIPYQPESGTYSDTVTYTIAVI